MATEAARLKGKKSTGRKKKNRLDTHPAFSWKELAKTNERLTALVAIPFRQGRPVARRATRAQYLSQQFGACNLAPRGHTF